MKVISWYCIVLKYDAVNIFTMSSLWMQVYQTFSLFHITESNKSKCCAVNVFLSSNNSFDCTFSLKTCALWHIWFTAMRLLADLLAIKNQCSILFATQWDLPELLRSIQLESFMIRRWFLCCYIEKPIKDLVIKLFAKTGDKTVCLDKVAANL